MALATLFLNYGIYEIMPWNGIPEIGKHLTYCNSSGSYRVKWDKIKYFMVKIL